MSPPDVSRTSAFRGVLGAFLGTFFACLLWLHLLPFIPEFLFKCSFFVACLLMGLASCLGYWLFHGWRGTQKARYFAYFATQISTVLAMFAAFLWFTAGLPDFSRADWLKTLLSRWNERCTPELLFSFGICALFALLGSRMGQGWLLRYTDPVWRHDPRRIAAINAGGTLYNYWPESLPVKQEIPKRFWVGGTLEISEETIRTIPTFGAGRTFLVYDVAGVIVGPSNGSNVLYDYHNQVLAKFAWSMDSAGLLVQYLKEYDVPFAPYHPKSKNGVSVVDSPAPGTDKRPRSG